MSEVAEMTRVASEIPDGWRTSTVGETAEILDSRRVPLNSEDRRSRSGPYPYWGANGIVDYIDDYIFDEPLVLMAEDGGYFDQAATRPICHRLDGPAWVNNHAHIIRPVGVDRDYFYYWFVHRDITPSIKGGTRAKLNQADLKRLPIWLPPLDEQRRIAEVLRSVDEAIAAAEAAADMAENLLIRVRDEIISQPIWDTTTLSDATSAGLFTDGDWVESKDQDPDGEVRLIQLADIGDGFFVDKSCRYLTMERARQLRCTFLQEGDLLIARMPDPLGRCCLFPAINQPSVTVVDVCVVRASQITSNRYLNHALATSEFRSQVLACASGTTRTRVSRGNLGQLELAMPPLAEQEAIADELDQVSIVAGEQRQVAEQLNGLKHGLMSDLLSGHVRVPA